MADSKIKWHDGNTLEVVKTKLTQQMKVSDRLTVKDARRMGLLPSVTSIIGDMLGAGYSLTNYMKEHVAMAAWDSRPRNDETKEKYIERMKRASEVHAAKAADAGSTMHKHVERYLKAEIVKASFDVLSLPMPAQRTIDGLNTLLLVADAEGLALEKRLGGLLKGFCGTPDIYAKKANLHSLLRWMQMSIPTGLSEYGELVIDLKTKEGVKPKGAIQPYREWRLQSGGYAELLEIGKNALFVQWIVDRVTGLNRFLVYTDLEEMRRCFNMLFEMWVVFKKYDPRVLENENES